jgi:hypothetical protein
LLGLSGKSLPLSIALPKLLTQLTGIDNGFRQSGQHQKKEGVATLTFLSLLWIFEYA